MSNYFDFDAWRKERYKDPFIIKAFGKEHQIPNDVPFDVVLGLARAMKEGADDTTEIENVENMAESVFGKETFREWRENGIGVNEIRFLTEHVMKMYSEQSQKIADKKKTGNP